jgi:hypothetical protein
MPRGKFKFVKACSLAGGVLLLCLLGWALIVAGKPLPRPPLPNPNGYDEFVKAARMLVMNERPLASLNEDELRAYVAANADALKLARTALTKRSRVPVEYTPAYMTNHITDLARLKGLALAFTAEARLALIEKRTNDAALVYLDEMSLSHEATRGGLIIDSLVGLASEFIGLVPLQSLVAGLDAGQCRYLARQLEATDAAAETVEQILAQEKDWSRHSFGLKEKLAELVLRRPSSQKFEQQMQRVQARRRQLLLDLAVRACELEKGRRPNQLKDLVPEYLKAIPIDPVTGTNLSYTL